MATNTSPLAGNDEATSAALLIDAADGHGLDDAERTYTAIQAQARASLALARELRTASLIQAATAKYADGSAMFPDLPLPRAIREALGFGAPE